MTRQPYSMRYASATPVAMPSVTTTDLIENNQMKRPQVTPIPSKQSPPSSIRHQQQLINVQIATKSSSNSSIQSPPPQLIKQQELTATNDISVTVVQPPMQCSPTKSLSESISSGHGSSGDFAASIQAALEQQQTPITISITSPPQSPSSSSLEPQNA